ncbi:arginine/serine-rich coiled-coil protein 2 isoform X2 [Bacillus rossius redtenbacheri]|uniref:arginine/serine-rich coiled-coil protein 2 isoform X2 n=1 Tax=Bacillus rossius redtenbacheri TaxID=93214 RepID=UPI002FDCC3C0
MWILGLSRERIHHVKRNLLVPMPSHGEISCKAPPLTPTYQHCEWDSDSDRRSASSDGSISRKSSRSSRSSRSSMSRSDDSSLRSDDENRSCRAGSEARSPTGGCENFEPSEGRDVEIECSHTVGQDDQGRGGNHSTSPHSEKRLSISPRDRRSSSDTSSESSDDSVESYGKKRHSPDRTDGESEHRLLPHLPKADSLSPREMGGRSSCPREKSVDNSSSPNEKQRKRSRSPSNKHTARRSRSPSRSKAKRARSPLRGKPRRSRSPVDHRTHYPRSPDKNRGHHGGSYTDRRKSSRSPRRKTQRISPARKSKKRSSSRNRRSSSPRDTKRKSNVSHDRNLNRKSHSPRNTKGSRAKSPCNKDKQSRSPERTGNKFAKQPEGSINEKNARNSSPRQVKQLQSPKQDDSNKFKSRSSRERHLRRRSCSSSDEEARKNLQSSTSKDEKDRKPSPVSVKSETVRRGERDRKRSPGDKKRSRSRSHGNRNSKQKHSPPVEDSAKASHKRRRSSSRHKSRSPHSSSRSRHSLHRRRSRPRSRSRGRDDSMPRHRRLFEKKPSKLSILEKLGIELRPAAVGPTVTPQQLLQQTFEQQKQQVESSTGIELPSYYNPAAVNPARYVEQIQKRRLLWGNKDKKPEAGEAAAAAAAESAPSLSNNQWEATTFARDQDGKMTAKFKRLMGIKETAATTAAATSVDSNTLLQKQEELFTSMEMQYEVARLATHSQRGVGLGYGIFQYPR